MADTGNTAALTFGTTGFSAAIAPRNMIGSTEFELPKINKSSLATTGFEEYIPGDLEEPGEVEIECQFDPGVSGTVPARGTVETVTITYPVKSGQSSGGTVAGTAFIRKVSLPELRNNLLMAIKVLVAWDGVTGPTYTPGS